MINFAEMHRDIVPIQGVRRRLDVPPDNIFIANSLDFALDLPGRKTFFENRPEQSFPPFIREVVNVVERIFEKHGYYNKVGVKKYAPGESSDAFLPHVDPDEYQGTINGKEKHIAIYNAAGYADFYIAGEVIPWVPGSAIEWNAGMEHSVSEPYAGDPENSLRIIYFLGNSNTVPQLN